jgi:hypothetical protein
MGRGIVREMLRGFKAVAEKLLDSRKPSNGTKYTIWDALKAGFAVTYFLHPSLLSFQKAQKKKHRKNNLETLFEIQKTPTSNTIKNIIDNIEPGWLDGVFDRGLRTCKKLGVYAKYKVLDGEIPVAVDCTGYYSHLTREFLKAKYS